MNARGMKLILIIFLLIFGMAGGISIVAAATDSWSPGAGTDPDFFSPDWKVPTYSSMFEPDLLAPDWKVPTYSSNTDPYFTYSNWTVPTYSSNTDPYFLTTYWKVPTHTSMYEHNFMY